MWASPWRDNYDPSRVLVTDVVREVDVAGDPVVRVPNRDTLLLAGSDDEGGRGRLVAVAEEAYRHPRSVSGMAYRLDQGDTWVPFLPAGDRPHQQRFKLPAAKTVGGDYAAQAGALKELHEKAGKDLFVAAFSLLQEKATGAVRSYCVWLYRMGLPFVGYANSQYVVRNMGGESIKCDRWIVALLRYVRMTAEQLEKELNNRGISLSLFDVAMWAYCERFVKRTAAFRRQFDRLLADADAVDAGFGAGRGPGEPRGNAACRPGG